MSALALASGCLVIALASMVQSTVGFGLALIAIPPLVLIDPASAPGPFLLASFLLALLMVWRDGSTVEPRDLAVPVLGLLAGTAVGATALLVVPADHLPRLFAVLILLAVGASASGLRVRITMTSLFAAGGLGGLIGTMAGVHGPPMVLLMQTRAGPEIRGTMGAFFIAGYAISLCGLAIVGLFGARELLLGLAICPGIVAGWLAAPLLIRRLDQQRLRWPILALSTAAALCLLVVG